MSGFGSGQGYPVNVDYGFWGSGAEPQAPLAPAGGGKFLGLFYPSTRFLAYFREQHPKLLTVVALCAKSTDASDALHGMQHGQMVLEALATT